MSTAKAKAPLATSTASQIAKPGLQFATASFVDKASAVVQTEPHWPRSCLLHGSLYGVPLGAAGGAENRPRPDDVQLVWGEHGDDVAATLASTALAPADASARRAYERLLAAFTGNLVDRIDSADGPRRRRGAGARRRLREPAGRRRRHRSPARRCRRRLARGRPPRARRGGARRRGRGAEQGRRGNEDRLRQRRRTLHVVSKDAQRADMMSWGETDSERDTKRVVPELAGRAAPNTREVRQAAPRFYAPLEPLVAVRGARRSLRHGGDGRASGDGKLHCRYPAQVIRAIEQVIDGAEDPAVARHRGGPRRGDAAGARAAVAQPVLGDTGSPPSPPPSTGSDAKATKSRMVAEAALRFGSTEAIYDGTSGARSRKVKMAGGATRQLTDERIADQLRRFSMVAGTDPYPVGITAWSQPWVPLWLEWEIRLDIADTLDGWTLGALDYEARRSPDARRRRRRVRFAAAAC